MRGERLDPLLGNERALLQGVQLLDALDLLPWSDQPPYEAVVLLVRNVRCQLLQDGDLRLGGEHTDALLRQNRELLEAPQQRLGNDALVGRLQLPHVLGLQFFGLGCLRLGRSALPGVDQLRHDHKVLGAKRLALLVLQVDDPAIALPAQDLAVLAIVLGSTRQAMDDDAAAGQQLSRLEVGRPEGDLRPAPHRHRHSLLVAGARALGRAVLLVELGLGGEGGDLRVRALGEVAHIHLSRSASRSSSRGGSPRGGGQLPRGHAATAQDRGDRRAERPCGAKTT
mmetsp:Transcript_95331/g.273354  ORF Transcript_95331/g.273354 Transcript_95331/m.273354 type:complete len:283 (+) Transcript_95331:231-1079(+)